MYPLPGCNEQSCMCTWTKYSLRKVHQHSCWKAKVKRLSNLSTSVKQEALSAFTHVRAHKCTDAYDTHKKDIQIYILVIHTYSLSLTHTHRHTHTCIRTRVYKQIYAYHTHTHAHARAPRSRHLTTVWRKPKTVRDQLTSRSPKALTPPVCSMPRSP